MGKDNTAKIVRVLSGTAVGFLLFVPILPGDTSSSTRIWNDAVPSYQRKRECAEDVGEFVTPLMEVRGVSGTTSSVVGLAWSGATVLQAASCVVMPIEASTLIAIEEFIVKSSQTG